MANRPGGLVGAMADATTIVFPKNVSAITPKNISVATSGANSLVTAQAGYRIVPLCLALISSGGGVGVYFASNATPIWADGTNKLFLDKAQASGPAGFVLPFSQVGWMKTTAGQALNLYLDGNVAVVGGMMYALELV